MAQVQVLGAAALALVMLALTTALHYEGLKLLGPARGGRQPRRRPVFAITALVALHLAEIGLYAVAYAGGSGLEMGSLRGLSQGSWLGYFYFAAETYSTFGYGDVVPRGALRLVASVEPLNGLLLLA
jgi:ion channel